MKKPRLAIAFLATMAATAVVGVSLDTQAWTRTISNGGCFRDDSTNLNWGYEWRCPVVSDSTMNPATATHVYADFTILVTGNAVFQACRANYLNTVQSCGASSSGSDYSPGNYDVPLALWGTTGASQWDYYYVDGTTDGFHEIAVHGIGVQGP